ncbi:hypothetical protein FACS1894137_09470 [Spirochaetia bacterium]|nr:hypothetical protein FACS1894137_09470 [Spirochaetia bacterium]
MNYCNPNKWEREEKMHGTAGSLKNKAKGQGIVKIPIIRYTLRKGVYYVRFKARYCLSIIKSRYAGNYQNWLYNTG